LRARDARLFDSRNSVARIGTGGLPAQAARADHVAIVGIDDEAHLPAVIVDADRDDCVVSIVDRADQSVAFVIKDGGDLAARDKSPAAPLRWTRLRRTLPVVCLDIGLEVDLRARRRCRERRRSRSQNGGQERPRQRASRYVFASVESERHDACSFRLPARAAGKLYG
jgi:hypothetical protein